MVKYEQETYHRIFDLSSSFYAKDCHKIPNTRDFPNDEKMKMVEKFPELVPAEVESHRFLIKLDPSVSEERQMDYFGVDDENKRSIHQRSVFSPEICCQVLSEAFTETFVEFLLAR